VSFSLLHRLQTGSGTHPASYPVGTGALSPAVKRSGRETDHSPPCSAEVKMRGAISTPHYVFMAWCLVKYRVTIGFSGRTLVVKVSNKASEL
jgi:hypothetical protein